MLIIAAKNQMTARTFLFLQHPDVENVPQVYLQLISKVIRKFIKMLNFPLTVARCVPIKYTFLFFSFCNRALGGAKQYSQITLISLLFTAQRSAYLKPPT